MERSAEEIQAEIDLNLELATLRKRLLGLTDEHLTHSERQLLQEKRAVLEAEKVALEEAAAAREQPERVTDAATVAKLSPAEAAKRAKAIRARPEYLNPSLRDAEGKPVISPEAHEKLVQEHLEYMERACAEEE